MNKPTRIFENNIIDTIKSIQERLRKLETKSVKIRDLSELSNDLGLITSGEFRAVTDPDNSTEPGSGFTGVRISGAGVEYDNTLWNIAGVKEDVIQFGLGIDDGKAYAGQGAVRIDQSGISLDGYLGVEEITSHLKWVIPGNVAIANIHANEESYGNTLNITASAQDRTDNPSVYNPPLLYLNCENQFIGGMVEISLSLDVHDTYWTNETGIQEGVIRLTAGDQYGAENQLVIGKDYTAITDDTTFITPNVKFYEPHNNDLNTADKVLRYNPDRQTLDFVDYDTVLQIGQELVFYVINQTGSDIDDGVAVMYDGALGASGIMKITPAIADGTYNAVSILGITTQPIPNGSTGKVTFFGEVHHFNTNGYSAGDILYLDPTNPGALTNVLPTAPNLKYSIATAVNSAVNGTIFVRAIFPPSLNDINDVSLTSPSAGEILKYDGSSWVNSPESGGSGAPNPSYLLNTSSECWSKTDGSFINTAIASGTINNTPGTANHPGVIKISSIASTNTGGSFTLPATDNIILGGVEGWQVIVSPQQSNSNVTGLIGFMDSYGASVTPNNALCVKFTGNGTNIDLAFLSRVAGAGSATNFTTLTAGTWYRIKMTNGGTGAVNVYVYNMAGTQLASYNFTGSVSTSAMGFGVKAYRINATASDLIFIDRVDLYSTSTYTR